jgi:hypothetical protein
MTKNADTTVQGSGAASTQGTEQGTNPLAILGDMAVTEVAEESETTDKAASGTGSDTSTTESEAETTEPSAAAQPGEDTAEAGEGRVTFSPEQQEVFNARLGKEVAKRKAEADKADALSTKVSTLEGELNRLKAATEANIPLHPEWTEKPDLDAIVTTNRLEAEVARLKANWRGIENDKDPDQSLTAEQVQQRYAQAAAELAALKPKADEAWRKAHQQFVEDAKLGRQIRAERAKAAAAAGKPTTEKPAAVVPAGQGAAGRPATSAPTVRGQNRERLEKQGGTREAAERELAELVPV